MESAGQHAQPAIFAADGRARHRLVRAAVAAGIALLAAWVIALALGVMGGFGSLPMLPGAPSNGSSNAGARAADPAGRAPAPAVRAHRTGSAVRTQSSSGGRTVTTRPHSTSVVPRPQKITGSVSGSSLQGSSSSLHGQATPRTTTGKPVGSPGNAAGGTGAPGQLR